eukprot:scaffold442_cov397-Prasinococcus_capsulatus_cf.AAC.2
MGRASRRGTPKGTHGAGSIDRAGRPLGVRVRDPARKARLSPRRLRRRRLGRCGCGLGWTPQENRALAALLDENTRQVEKQTF